MESGGVEVGECSPEVIAASPTRAHTHSPVQRSSGILVRSISDLTHPTLLWLFSEAGGASIVCLGGRFDRCVSQHSAKTARRGAEDELAPHRPRCFCCCRSCFSCFSCRCASPASLPSPRRTAASRQLVTPQKYVTALSQKERERGERQARSAYSSAATKKKSRPDADVSLLKEIRRS